MRPSHAEVSLPASSIRSVFTAAAAGVLWGAQGTWDGPGLCAAVGAILAASAERGQASDWVAGWVFGVMWHGLALGWTPAAWSRLGGPLGVPYLLVGCQALPVAVAVGMAGLATRRGLPLPLATAVAGAVAHGFADRWGVLQRTTAVLLVDAPQTLWIAAFAGRAALSSALMAWPALTLHRLRWGLWSAVAMLGTGLAWQPAQNAGPSVRVGIVQPDTGALDGRRPSTAETRAAEVRALAEQARHAGAGWVLTTESAWPHDVGAGPGQRRRDLHEAWFDGPSVLLDAPVGRFPTNSHEAAEQGGVTGRVDKQVLVPVAERRWAGLGADRYRPGSPARTVTMSRVEVAGWICHEDLFTTTAAQVDDVWLGVAASNDIWLGPLGVAPHLRATRLLAVLTGRWVVRTATSGPSALVDPAGRPRCHTQWVDGQDGEPGRAVVLDVPLRLPWWTGAAVDHVVPWLALWGWLGWVLRHWDLP